MLLNHDDVGDVVSSAGVHELLHAIVSPVDSLGVGKHQLHLLVKHRATQDEITHAEITQVEITQIEITQVEITHEIIQVDIKHVEITHEITHVEIRHVDMITLEITQVEITVLGESKSTTVEDRYCHR